jgi:hypothetical protein
VCALRWGSRRAGSPMNATEALDRLSTPTAAAALRWLVDVERWDSHDDAIRRRTCEHIAGAIPELSFDALEWRSHPTVAGEIRHAVARFTFEDRPLVLVPGGDVALGLVGSVRDVLLRVAPRRSFERFDAAGVIDNLARDPIAAGASFTPARVVAMAPFLVESETRPFIEYRRDDDDWVDDILANAGASPWRLPTPDEWEHLYAAATRTLFPWGDRWPGADGCPVDPRAWTNAYGLHFADRTECTSTPSLLGGGDPDGWNLNGFDGGIVHASAYVMHPTHVDNCTWEFHEQSGVRRVLPLE